MFRYDPAVLIVSLNWQMSDVTFGRGLQHQMAIKYKGHEDLVSLHSNPTQKIE